MSQLNSEQEARAGLVLIKLSETAQDQLRAWLQYRDQLLSEVAEREKKISNLNDLMGKLLVRHTRLEDEVDNAGC